MIPDQLRLVPVYQIMNGLGFTKSNPTNYLSVFLILAVSATSIFLLRQYFLGIPRDLEEAARIDGAGHFQTYWKVILPLAGPALAAVAILQFQGTWNGLFWPAIFFGPVREHWTLPFGIVQFQGIYQTDWPPLMAIVVVATIPILVPVRLLPALLHRGHRGVRCQGLKPRRDRRASAGPCARAALDLYYNFSSFIPANVIFGIGLIVAAAAVANTPWGAVVGMALVPVTAGCMALATTLVRDGHTDLGEFAAVLRRPWLALGLGVAQLADRCGAGRRPARRGGTRHSPRRGARGQRRVRARDPLDLRRHRVADRAGSGTTGRLPGEPAAPGRRCC